MIIIADDEPLVRESIRIPGVPVAGREERR